MKLATSLGGTWRTARAEGSFTIEGRVLEVRVGARGLIGLLREALTARSGPRAALREAIEELLRELGLRLVIKGPLGVRVAELGG